MAKKSKRKRGNYGRPQRPPPNGSPLHAWMMKKRLNDTEVAERLGISRVQVCRIRHRISGTTMATAKKIEKLTGIHWYELLETQRISA
jgi:hypothetical protein